ncbi:MAG: polyprenyl diphosphate synthase [Candidatus Woesearchaeota archaeon]
MINMESVPKHIAIIMDGNRRFSRRLLMKPWKGHEWGAKKVEQVIEWCREFNIRELTLYTFSIQNFNRPKEEFDYLMKIFNENFDKLTMDKRLSEHKIRIRFIGRLSMFPENIYKKMQNLMELTRNNDEYTLNFAMAYGGREEVIDAVRRIADDVKKGLINPGEIDEIVVERSLYMKDEPDLIIRTGGEKRISNFLSYQSAYSELYFIDKMWPEFEKEDFIAALQEYSKRERRFGR